MPRPPRAELRARHAFAFAITALAGFAAVLAPACVLPPPVAAADQAGPPGGFGPPGGVAAPPPPAVPGPPGSDGERPVVEGPGAAGALVVHLDGWGGRVHAGPRDDAGADVSNIVTEAGLAHVDVPAFEGTALEWIALEACVARAYAGLPITLVRRPPSERPYVRVIVGGSAAMLGPTDRWGVASTGPGTVVTDGVGFVFSADHQTTTRGLDLCQSVSHELGHLIGLPHTPDCRDLMSDDRSCPHEAFSELSRARLEASLRRLGIERIDLLQIHNVYGLDELMPHFLEYKKAGKIRYIGISTSVDRQYEQMQAALAPQATTAQIDAFGQTWQGWVRAMLIDHADDPELITVED